MLDLVGRVPDPGDSVDVDGFRLTAVDVRGRRIDRVRIEPLHGGGGGGHGEDGDGEDGEGDDGGSPTRNGN
jgi:hypothetical protein